MQASSRNVVLERLTPSRNSTLNLTESAELTSSSSTRLITWTMSTPSCMNSRERDRSVTSRTRRSESSESVTTTRFRQSLAEGERHADGDRDIVQPVRCERAPYNSRDRADRAFVEGTCDDSAIARAAAIAAKDRGNARQAIDLSVSAAKSPHGVTTNGSTTHTSSKPKNSCSGDDCGTAFEIRHSTHSSCSKPRRTSNNKGSHRHGRERSRTDTRRSPNHTLWIHLRPLRASRTISDLHMLGFLQRRDRNHGEGGGRYYEYQLDLDPQIVVEIRQEAEAKPSP